MPPKPLSQRLIASIESVLVGKHEFVVQLVSAFLAGGHVLIEDVPGVGKTMAARALARSLDLPFKRIQFTPDLLPSDLTGVSLFNQKTTEFEFRRGPLFAGVLLADELNRATPRTQSALLECMEERTVTVDGTTHPLPPPFFVMATQNPVEQQGVYQLPEAQLDRFLVRLGLGYASVGEERAMVEAQRLAHPIDSVVPVADCTEVLAEQHRIRETVLIEPNVADYLVRVVTATREHRDVLLGASPRGSLALSQLCRARAAVEGIDYVTPDLVKSQAAAALAHRLVLRPQSRLGGIDAAQVIEEILRNTDVPTTRLIAN